LQVLAALVDDQAAKGEYASVVTHAQRYLEIDDLSEAIRHCLHVVLFSRHYRE
jgi:hypothetical protein